MDTFAMVRRENQAPPPTSADDPFGSFRPVRLDAIIDEEPERLPMPDVVHPPVSENVLERWVTLSVGVNNADREAAWALIIQGERRIWAKLGHLLRRSVKAQAFRAARFVSVRVLRHVKRWYPKGTL